MQQCWVHRKLAECHSANTKHCQRDLSHIIIPFKSGEMLSCNTTSSIFQSLSTTSRYCLYTQALSLNGLIIKMNYQPINVKSMRSTTRNERTLEKMDCSECTQDIGENLLLKWNYQDLLKRHWQKSNAHELWFWLRLRGIKIWECLSRQQLM